jgi:hypothetical protein
MIRLRDILSDILSEKKTESKKPDFDRAEYYKEYIERLVPSNFKVELKNQEVIIKIKD